jgi:indolepyruvate decarboxylase
MKRPAYLEIPRDRVGPEVPLVADTGDCLSAAVEIRSNDCVAPAYYATMGFAIPAALGLQVARGRFVAAFRERVHR